MAIFDVSTIPYAGSQSDPVASLVFCGTDHNTDYTIINGKVVVDHRQLVGFDEQALADKANAISRKLMEKAANKEMV